MKWFGLNSIIVVFAGASVATASPMMYISDSGGTLAKVDSSSGNVMVIGRMAAVMTDIAFDPTGALFGISFNNLYAINQVTAAVTVIGRHSVPGGNALVFGFDGTLYAAGASSTSLFTMNPATGESTSVGSMGFASGGDLAFHDGNFYLASTTSQLVRIELGDLAESVSVGSFGVPGLFGLASGPNGILYGVAGTSIFSVDPSTAVTESLVDFYDQGLGATYGQAFRSEAVPEPSTLLLPIIGFILLLAGRCRSPFNTRSNQSR
jgi:hypothetical protein